MTFRGALEHAARDGRRLRLESVACRAVLSVVDAFVDVRGELAACEAARDAAMLQEVADLKGQLRRVTESAEYEAERARRAELDRNAEVSTLRDDRQRLAWRWGRERIKRQQWQGSARW
ncbi:hypothetical protein [Myxococcus vastator]|uniref:hypothetical protein n=1 Tax=Myxococcus vastator TaxID=2709664 RepID=UPI0013D0112A|nr:hypothetical protein [Myxococcus vastator]